MFSRETTKKEKIINHQVITMGDNILTKIQLTLWEPIGNPDNSFNVGDLVAVKNCRIFVCPAEFELSFDFLFFNCKYLFL